MAELKIDVKEMVRQSILKEAIGDLAKTQFGVKITWNDGSESRVYEFDDIEQRDAFLHHYVNPETGVPYPAQRVQKYRLYTRQAVEVYSEWKEDEEKK